MTSSRASRRPLWLIAKHDDGRTVRIEKILCNVLDEAHKRQVEEITETLSEGPEGFYKSHLN